MPIFVAYIRQTIFMVHINSLCRPKNVLIQKNDIFNEHIFYMHFCTWMVNCKKNSNEKLSVPNHIILTNT